MAKRDSYKIRIPAGDGVQEEYRNIDPQTFFKNGNHTKLYEWDSRRQKHVQILGNEGLLKQSFDADELLALWAEFVEQMEYHAALQTGTAAGFMNQLTTVAVDMTRLIELVSLGQVGAAREALASVGFGIVQASAFATNELARLEGEATRHGELAEAMVSIVADQDKRTQAEGESLADKIDHALRASDTLKGYEIELDQQFERLESRSRAWRSFSEDESGWLQERLDQLSNRETGFCSLASRYLYAPADPDAAEAMASAVSEARKHVQVIEARIAAAQDEHVSLKASTEAALEQQFGIDVLIRTLRDCRKAVEEAGNKGVDAFSLVSGLITFEEYHRWKELSRDPNWRSLHAVQVRFRDKADAVRRLFDYEPKLSDTGRAVLKRTTHYIGKLEVELAEFGLELDEAEEHEVKQQSAGSSPRSEVHGPKPANDRLEEIYEMVLAIGAIKYCGPEPLRLGTPGSMLKILLWLGRITETEVELYSARLEKRLEDDSVFVDRGEDRLAAWQETEPSEAHWIMVRQRRGNSPDRYPMWKLVEQARDKALSLGMHYKLDPLDVRKASDALRAKKP